jgi:ankyrin repeat protein
VLLVTPLHWAAAMGFADLIPVLIKKGADVNAKDGSAQTPLAAALENKEQSAADVLRGLGARE